MSAPAALAMSKLLYPETERSVLVDANFTHIPSMRFKNAIQAASRGAVMGIPLVAATLANQICFVSILEFVNFTVGWFAARAGLHDFDFITLCSYILFPIVFAQGTEVADCKTLGSLLGIKLFGTPILAYTELGIIKDNRLQLQDYMENFPNSTWGWQGDDIFLDSTNVTLVGGVISVRSEIIATYMLCGFSTITSIGVCLGIMSALAEERRNDIIATVFNAWMAGNFACFLTASVAGLMFQGNM